MKIAILGTGNVGRTIASKLVAQGHQVCMGSRSASNEGARAWAAEAGKGASHGTFTQAASFAEVVFNCVKGEVAIAALTAAGAEALDDKILVDLSNPLDFSRGMPPSLTVCNTDSMGEQIQRAFPDSRVVKALNTLTAGLMVNPGALPEPTNLLICGDDAEAKAVVRQLLQGFGWGEADILDLGDISASRGMEAWLLLWVRLYGAQGTAMFNIRLVRAV